MTVCLSKDQDLDLGSWIQVLDQDLGGPMLESQVF